MTDIQAELHGWVLDELDRIRLGEAYGAADGLRQLRDLTASKLASGNGRAKVLPGR